MGLVLVLVLAQHLVFSIFLGPDGAGAYVRLHTDFLHILTAAQILSDGHGAQLYDVETQRAAQNRILTPYMSLPGGTLLPYNHPPMEAMLLVPWIHLPYEALFVAWVVLLVAAIGLSFWLLAQAVPLPPIRQWLFMTVIASYHPFHIALWSGQSTPFMLLGLCGAYTSLKRQRPGWAGAWLVLVTVKPQVLPVVLLVLVMCGAWKAVASWAGVMGVIGVLAMPFLGLTWPLQYLHFVLTTSQMGPAAYIIPAYMPTWRGLVSNLFASWPQAITPAFILMSLLSVGAVVWGSWQVRPGQERRRAAPIGDLSRADFQWALATIVAILVSLHLGAHDLLLLVLPCWLITVYATAPGVAPVLARSMLASVWACYAIPLLILVSPQTLSLIALPLALLAYLLLRLVLEPTWLRRSLEAESWPQGEVIQRP